MEFSTEDLYFAVVGSDMKSFIRHAFSTIHPGKEFDDNWHINSIIHHLELSIQGKMPRLIINLPPRSLKSFIVSVVLPAFILGIDPTAKIICISYSDELARALARDFRRVVESGWYQQIFPHVKPSKMTETEWVTGAGGFRYATSVGGTLTGRGGDFIIIDDPQKPEEAESEKLRQNLIDWYQGTLLSRLDDKQNGVLIVVMQRLHLNDLTGFIQDSGFRKLSFPAIAIKNEDIPISDTETYHRKAGEPLHEKREGLETLEKMRLEAGSYNFAAQYQQTPDCPDGNKFKRAWLNIINQPPNINSEGYFFVSIDPAASDAETANFSAICAVYSNREGNHYVLSVERGRWEYEMLKAKVLSYAQRYGKTTRIIVEGTSSGVSLLQFLRGSEFICFPYRPKYDKTTRASFVVPLIEEGRLSIVNVEGQNDWVESFIDEIVSFPYGRYDDQVDSLVQALLHAERLVNSDGKIHRV